MNLIKLETAVDQIQQACEDEPQRHPFFFLIGAGVSHPSVPLACEIEAHCRDAAMKRGREASSSDAAAVPLDNYSYWFEAAYPQAKRRQRYLRELIVGKAVSHANLRLAHLLSSRRVASLVVTPNFDDHLSRALDLFGVPHILCDHPRTVERIDPEVDEIQLVHVHGTYSFYDCCNLRGEIEGRAQQARETTATMAFLLDSIMTSRSPLVIGYSGWEGDVIMTALRRRIEGRRLGVKVYWFCYRRDGLSLLPPWLDHQDVAFVVPPEPARQQPSSARVRPAQITRGAKEIEMAPPQATAEKSGEEPTLAAQTVFDSLIARLKLPAPELTIDPIGFFTQQLRALLPGDTGESRRGEPYFFQGIVERLNQANKLLQTAHKSPIYLAVEQVRDAIRRSQYRDAIKLCTELDLQSLDATQCHEMAEVAWLAARALTGCPEDELRGYSLVVDFIDHSISKGASNLETIARLADALVSKGVRLGRLERSEEELQVYDQVVERFGTATEPALRERVAGALFNKGVTLGQLERSEEELQVYDQVVERFGTATEPALREQVARALVNKGVT